MGVPVPETPKDRAAPSQRDRSIRRLATRFLAIGISSAAWLILAWWLFGRIVSDRFAWSQWASWTPTELVLLASGVMICLGRLLVRVTATTEKGRRKWVLPFFWACLLVWMVAGQWRVAAAGGRLMFGYPDSTFSVLSWNATEVPGPDLLDALPPGPLDLVIITNPLRKVDWDGVSERVGPGSASMGLGRAKIVTKHQILSWGSVSLGMNGRVSATRQEGAWIDSGWAGFFELDTTAALGRPMVVWIVDLPSDLAIPRRAMSEAAAQAIHTWAGPAMSLVEGTPTVIPLDTPGFPEPDIIIGDFNMPRGSWSLSAITGSLTNAWSDAGTGGGVGPFGSWPRTKPIFHLDQTFIARDLRSCSYELMDLGVGKHRAQVVKIGTRK